MKPEQKDESFLNTSHAKKGGWQWGAHMGSLVAELGHIPPSFCDQDLLNMAIADEPDRFRLLDCRWNYRPDFCAFDEYDCRRCPLSETTGPPKLLHGSRHAFSEDTNYRVLFRVVHKLFLRLASTAGVDHDEDDEWRTRATARSALFTVSATGMSCHTVGVILANTIDGLLDRFFAPLNAHRLQQCAGSAVLAAAAVHGAVTVASLRAALCTRSRPALILHVENGLANRLRALVSASLLARRSGRQLVVVWPTDDHCHARFEDLFAVGSTLSSWSQGKNHDTGTETTGTGADDPADVPIVLDRLEEAVFEAEHLERFEYEWASYPVLPLTSSRAPIYVRSAYWLVADCGDTRSAADRRYANHGEGAQVPEVNDGEILDELRRWKPALDVQSVWQSELTRVQEASRVRSRQSRVVGVHIRMQTNISLDVPHITTHQTTASGDRAALARVEADSHEARLNCHYTHFLVAMRQLYRIYSGRVVYYVATDSPEILAHVKTSFPSGVVLSYAGPFCRRSGQLTRSADCMRRAYVELLVLSASSVLLVSQWTTFSDLAIRMSSYTPGSIMLGCGRHTPPQAPTDAENVTIELEASVVSDVGGHSSASFCPLLSCMTY